MRKKTNVNRNTGLTNAKNVEWCMLENVFLIRWE